MIKVFRTSLFILLTMTISIPLSSQDLIQNIDGRSAISLNGRWNFIIDPYEMGYYDYRLTPFDQSEKGSGGFYDNLKDLEKSQRAEYDFSHSESLKVPGDWNSQYEKLSFYEGTVWYQQDFKVSLEKGKRYFIHFGAVNYEAHVYLNGKKLGMHVGGFTPFQYEVTGKLSDGDNFIVVKVDNKRHKDAVPTTNTDWWNYGGITRDVTLVITPETFIQDYKVQLDRDNPNILKGFVRLDGPAKEKTVTLSIEELKISKELKTDASGLASFEIPVKKITYWSPENPKLYSVKLSSDNENLSDLVGFRTIQTEGKKILLNGKETFLRGISMHDENPFIPGRIRNDADAEMMLRMAKELGCNMVRLAHYTHNEKTIRIADKLGLMVWAEVPVYWTITWENEATFQNAKDQLTANVTRDKNRAAVIIWSIGNETPVAEARNQFMGALADHVRSMDDTRLVAAALEIVREGYELHMDDPLGEKLDLASFNEYGGWYWESKPDELYKYTYKIKYNKPVFISEWGGGALAGFHGDKNTMWSEELQENIYINQLKMLEGIDGLAGMSPWILVDFRSPRRQNPVYQDFWNRKGVISETGQKKKAYYVLQEYYRKKAAEME